MPVLVPALVGDTARGDVTAQHYAQWLDGLVLHGGVDMSPTSYGEEPLHPDWAGDRARDLYEMELIRAFVAAGKPVFGICRGLQVVNVTYGGTLYQDISTQRPQARLHRDGQAYDRHFHPVQVVAGTRLDSLLGAAASEKINSIHHQGIKDLAPDFVAEAFCPEDGTIEAISESAIAMLKPRSAMALRSQRRMPAPKAAEIPSGNHQCACTMSGRNSCTARPIALLPQMINPSNAACLAGDATHRPTYGMRRQFNELLPKLLEPWNWSLFGDGTGQSGSVFYQTVWSFTRYAADRWASSEANFFTTVTSATTTGVTSLANAAGVSIDQMIGGWSLALYTDDFPGLISSSADLKIPTWNTREIYIQLSADPVWRTRFTLPFPLVPATGSFGAFTASQVGIRGGAAAYFRFSGTMSAAQVLELRAFGGGAPAATLRIAIARLP